ncbi:MAG TPA: hypothetical protein VJC06_03080 [Candidatus Paceibacterota bacterium]
MTSKSLLVVVLLMVLAASGGCNKKGGGGPTAPSPTEPPIGNGGIPHGSEGCPNEFQLHDGATGAPVNAWVRVVSAPPCGGTVRVNTIPAVVLELYQDIAEQIKFSVWASKDGERPIRPSEDPIINHPWSVLGGTVPRGQWVRRDFGNLIPPGISASSKPKIMGLGVTIGLSSSIWFGPLDCQSTVSSQCNLGQGMVTLDLNIID